MNYYIEFLNKEKNFTKDVISFSTFEEAITWGRENLANFTIDMININL